MKVKPADGPSTAADGDLRQQIAEGRPADEIFRVVVEATPNAIVLANAQGRILLVNAGAEKLFGYPREELIGQPVEKLLPERFRATHPGYRLADAGHAEAWSMGTSRDLFALRKDGSEVPIEIGLNPIETPEGPLILRAIIDITERKRAEEAAAQLAAIVESSDDAIIGKDLGGIVTSWNAAAERIFGYSASEMIGHSIARLIPPARQEEEAKILGQIARGESVRHFETVRVRKDGSSLDVSVMVSAIKDPAGRIVGASKVARDITQERRAVTTLGASETALGVSEKALGASERALGASEKALGASEKALGASEKALGVSETALGASEKARGVSETALGASEKALGVSETALGASEKARGVSETALGASEKALGVSETALGASEKARGVSETALGASEKALGVSETALGASEKARGVSETALGASEKALGVSETALGASEKARGVSETALGASEKALGVSETALGASEMARGASETALGASEMALGASETARGASEMALGASELRYRRLFETAKDGILILNAETGMVVDVNPFLITILGYSHEEFLGKAIWELGFFKSIVANKDKFAEFRAKEYLRYETMPLETPRGQRIEVEFVSNVYVVNGCKVIQCNVRDVTARRKAEEAVRQLYAELEQRVIQRTVELEAANKELEAFSYSVSHDLRAPLRAVDGFSQAVLEDYGPQLPEEGQRYLKIIREGAQQMGLLIDDLLTFSRLSRAPLKKQEVNTAKLVRSALDDLSSQQEGRQLEVRIGELPACTGDPALLKQVWINLLSNAFKYTRRREPAVVEIGCSLEQGENGYFVRDNGAGFDMRYQGKLFGVFQRLHRAEEYEGTGVGLAIVQRIVHRHGGRVWADAAVDRGATFYFTLAGESKRR